MVWFLERNHIFSIMFLIITLRKTTPVSKVIKLLHILFGYRNVMTPSALGKRAAWGRFMGSGIKL